MRLLEPRSEVARADDGWVWLRPQPRSLRGRQTLAWALVTLTLGAGAAGVAFIAPLPAAAFALAALAVAVAAARAAARAAHTRAGACAAGVLVQMGARVAQAGWDAVGRLHAAPAGSGRARLVVDFDQGPVHTTRATFEADALGEWLESAAAVARTGGHGVEPLDGGPGFAVSPRGA